MEEKENPKWKRFEKLVANIQSSFAPDAEVKLDDHTRGKASGAERQLDISVRRQVGQFEIFIVIDCKDYSDPVDIKDIEEFIGLLEDVGANKGAMVAANGFTGAAKTRAKHAGIDLYRLVDAEEHEWQSYVSIPVVCDFRALGSGRFRLGGSKGILEELAAQDPRYIPLFNASHNPLGTPLTLMWRKWNNRHMPSEPGSYMGISLSDQPVLVQSKDGHFEEIDLATDVNVVRKLYFGQLRLAKVTGFRDEVTGQLLLPGDTEIITDWIDTVEVERKWLRIPSIDALAINPVIILHAFDHYPVDFEPTLPPNSQGSAA